MPSSPRRTAISGLAGLLACAATLGACSSSTPPKPTAGSYSPANTTNSAPAAAATTHGGFATYLWQRVDSPALSTESGSFGTLSAVLAPIATSQWLVAGTTYGLEGRSRATVWTSADATSWQRQALPSPYPDSVAQAAAQYHNSVAVGGFVGSGALASAAVWLWSTSQPSWRLSLIGTGPDSQVDLLADGPLGLVAVGQSSGRLELWTSADGSHWQVAAAGASAILANPTAVVESVVEQQQSIYVGGYERLGPYSQPVVWSSSDGAHWRQVDLVPPASQSPRDERLLSLAPFRNGLAAVGAVRTDRGWQPAAWLSPNGLSWSEPSEAFGPSAIGPAAALTSEESLSGSADLLAVGGSQAQHFLWQSTNGITWSSLALPSPAATSDGWNPTLVASTSKAVLVADSEPGQAHLLAWLDGSWQQPSSDPTVFGSTASYVVPLQVADKAGRAEILAETVHAPQAVGPSSVSFETISTRNGYDWRASAPEPGAPGVPLALPSGSVAALQVSGDWLAVGVEGGLGRSWVSPDGLSWEPHAGLAGKGARPVSMCPAGRNDLAGAVAVGSVSNTSGSPMPQTWETLDASSWTPGRFVPASAGEVEGCLPSSSGLVAFGLSANGASTPRPAIWTSPDGVVWSLKDPGGLGPQSSSPVEAMAVQGSLWVAATGGIVAHGPGLWPGGFPPGVGSGPQLWLSVDAGGSWTQVDPSQAPWGFAPGVGPFAVMVTMGRPVVVGSLNGQLAAWVGSDKL